MTVMDVGLSGTSAGRVDNLEAQVRTFLEENFYVADPAALAEGASLLDSGVIDSTGVLEVISWLEKEQGVQVADDEVVPENLDSIARIASFVRRKRAAAR